MKHEYHFTISRTDRIWLICFVCLLLGWELIKPLLPAPVIDQFSFPAIVNDDSTQVEKVYKNNYQRKDEQPFKKHYLSSTSYHKNNFNAGPKSPINIMEATWQELRALGFHPNVASNIERYLAAGGEIENQQQLMKIYGMDSVQWKAVSPYVIFPENNAEIKEAAGTTTYTKHQPKETLTILDLNTTTIEELDKLPGIGMVLAERIIKYRNSLGGFVSVNQIKECYGLPPETFEKIHCHLKITSTPIRIPINTVDLKSFTHPYLNKKMARVIDSYRQQHGVFSNADDLRKAYPGDTTWYQKLMPYLVFE